MRAVLNVLTLKRNAAQRVAPEFADGCFHRIAGALSALRMEIQTAHICTTTKGVVVDRFIDAMISIREEIRAIEEGRMDPEDNPLKNAPHTVDMVCADEWNHAYSREQAAYPVQSLRQYKYWSPVGRVDNVFGDTNLVCSCPPLSAYAEDDA